MTDKLYIVLSPGKFLRFKKRLFETGVVHWLYLGKDYSMADWLEKNLDPRFVRTDIVRIQDDISSEIRGRFVKWMNELNDKLGNCRWSLEERILNSIPKYNLFQFYCHLKVLARLWDDNKRPKVIFVESKAFAEVIRRWAIDKQINAIMIKSILDVGTGARVIGSFVKYGLFVFLKPFRWVAALLTRLMCKPKKILAYPAIILDTFIFDNSISGEGQFNDIYYPGLHEYLRKCNINVLVHPVLFGFHIWFYSIFKRMRKSATRFIIREDYLRVSDYIAAIYYPVSAYFKRYKEVVLFDTYDMTDLIREERRWQSLAAGVEPVLIYRLFLRLGKSGMKVRSIVDWYENQDIDKALIAGAKRAFPNVLIIGAQIFIHSANNLSEFPIQSEADANMVPDILLETSEYQCKVATQYVNNVMCYAAASLKHVHVFDDANNGGMDRLPGCNDRQILVCLTSDIGESIEMLKMVNSAMDLIGREVKIIIKCHPACKAALLIRKYGKRRWPSLFEVFNGSISSALDHARVVISTSTSPMVESAAKGIPVIFMGRKMTLNHNLMENVKLDILTECFTVEELVNAVRKYLDLSTAEINKYKAMGKTVRDFYFTPINEQTMSAFISG